MTIISEETYHLLFTRIKLEKTKVSINTYSDEPLYILGLIYIDVAHKNRFYKQLKLFVIGGSGVNLLGRNWLNIIQLDWCNVINAVNTVRINYENTKDDVPRDVKGKLDAMFLKYKRIFEDRIGTLKGYNAN